MKSDEQLKEWLLGNPIHNDEEGECCPDFSCCSGQEPAPLETRKKFAEAVATNNEELKMQMLMMFLGNVIAQAFGEDADKVYVAGQGPRDETIQ